MTAYPSLAAGMILTAKNLRDMQWNTIVKSANQDSAADSLTFVDDTELSVPLEANASYYMIFHLALGGTQSTGPHFSHIVTEYSTPSGATGFKWSMGPRYPGDATSDRENTAMVSAVHGFATDRQYGTISLTSAAAAIEHVQITTSTTAGNITLRFSIAANTTASGEVARLLAGSFVSWVRTG